LASSRLKQWHREPDGPSIRSRHSINIRTDAFLNTVDIGATHDELERTITIEYKKRPESQEE
jgi:hypothetical protein